MRSGNDASHGTPSRLFAALKISALFLYLIAAPAAAQEIWFGPLLPRAPHTHVAGILDWRKFLDTGAPWQVAASHTKVFSLDPNFVAEASDDDLLELRRAMAAHGIVFGVGLQPVAVERGEGCGHTEGYDDPRGVDAVAAKLKRLDFPVEHLELDGPLWFGHYATGPEECGFSVVAVVTRTARTARLYLDRFPNAQVGDIEGVPSLLLQPDWKADYRSFKAGLERAIGRKIISLTLDVGWPNPAWPQAVETMVAFIRSLGMKLGIFYNGDSFDDGDAAWIAHARRNFVEMETKYGVIPDKALFVSWDKFPTRALPETSPTAHTWLIDQYLLPRTRFEVSHRGGHASARLVDATNHPVTGWPVEISQLGVDPLQPPPERVATGTVPAAARSAILGIRVNTECFCSGANDLVIGDIAYQDNGGASGTLNLVAEATRTRGPRADGVSLAEDGDAGPGVVRLRVAPNQHFLMNSAPFAVTPGAKFSFRVPLGSVRGEGLFGGVAVIWLDEGGRGVSRVNVLNGGDKRHVATVNTGANGSLVLPEARGVLELNFSGTASLRPAIARIDTRSESAQRLPPD